MVDLCRNVTQVTPDVKVYAQSGVYMLQKSRCRGGTHIDQGVKVGVHISLIECFYFFFQGSFYYIYFLSYSFFPLLLLVRRGAVMDPARGDYATPVG